MSDIPDELTLEVSRDREGKRDVLARRISVGAIAVFLALALVNLFGQRPSTTAAEAAPRVCFS